MHSLQELSARVLQLNPDTIEYDDFLPTVEDASAAAVGRSDKYICRMKRQFV